MLQMYVAGISVDQTSGGAVLFLQDDAERTERDEALGGVRLHIGGRQECLRVFRIIVADPGALLGLRHRLSQGFAHLGGHDGSELVLSFTEQPAQRPQPFHALPDGGLAPCQVRLVRFLDNPGDLLGRCVWVAREERAGGRIDSGEGHYLQPCSGG